MKKVTTMLLGIAFAATGVSMAVAQEKTQSAVPKILQIVREYTKPGKGGMAHDNTESAFVRAVAKAKVPGHYIAMNSLTGRSRALFLSSYESYEAMEKTTNAMFNNGTLSAELDRINTADGELLEETDQSIWTYQEEMSLNSMADLSHMRYMELSVYQVRPGHGREWEELVKLVKAAYGKANFGAHWAMFERRYGGEGDEYLVLTARNSFTELDKGFEEGKEFAAAAGEDGLKKLDELVASATVSSHHELFAFNPRMSYVTDEWIKADPFWKPKAPAAPAAKPAADAKTAKP
jgi:hypothetical protein